MRGGRAPALNHRPGRAPPAPAVPLPEPHREGAQPCPRPNKGSSVVSAGDNWDSGISMPSLVSMDATTTYNARRSDGPLPSTTFLTTGSTRIGATMN